MGITIENHPVEMISSQMPKRTGLLVALIMAMALSGCGWVAKLHISSTAQLRSIRR